MKVVLIVCPEGVLGSTLADRLSRDCAVHTCSQTDAALDLLGRLRPDTLIIDLSMPGGLSVLQKAQRLPPRVVALTRQLNDAAMAALDRLGVYDIVRIPCAPDSILV